MTTLTFNFQGHNFMELVFHDVICSLSSSLDLVGVTEVHHGKRVALMAASMAKKLEWGEEAELNMLYAGMLHDCGVSSTEDHNHLVSELEWADAQAHCERGHRYLKDCPVLAKYAPWILYHHTRWSELKTLDLSKKDKLAANLLFLVDRIDFLQAKYVNFNRGDGDILLEYHHIEEEVQAFRGTFFAPILIDVFLEISKRESFWLAMDSSYIESSVRAYCKLSERKNANFPMLLSIAALFSKVIDAKSHYTKEHSKYVAVLARFLAKKMGFDKEEQQHIELAGMLHDLGKLRVPDYILNKTSMLNESERACIQRHSFDTMQILRTVFPQTKIAEWASYHHENLAGDGYPFHLSAGQLDLGSRIVAVADVFQALVQKRPYRDSLSLQEIKLIMDDMVSVGKLDEQVVAMLEQHHEDCYHLAQSSQTLESTNLPRVNS
jgi:putative nucleotidyltransferase with HDIG domain